MKWKEAKKKAGQRERGITLIEMAFALSCAVLILAAGYGLLGAVGGASAETMRGLGTLRESMKAMDGLRGDLQTARVISVSADGTSLTYTLPLAIGDASTIVNDTGEVQWGIADSEGELLGGSCTLSFVIERQVGESTVGRDINKDGDKVDVFDVGHLVKTSSRGHRMTFPTIRLLLKSGDRAGDVTGDGEADPIFAASANGLLTVHIAQRDGGKLRVRTFRTRPIELGDAE